MTEATANTLVEFWLVAAFAAVLILMLLAYRPSAKAEMERNARIPFMLKDDTDGPE